MDSNTKKFSKQAILYGVFAVLMVLLNILIQHLNIIWLAPFVEKYFGSIDLIRTYYLSTEPVNYLELVGSVIAVGITYIVKFLLDKFIVFEKKELKLKDTSEEFTKYFIFAILTTLENIGIQFILGVITNWALTIRIIIALTAGYTTKFFLDRKYVFHAEKSPESV
jgi:putative flippase GtrA